MGSKTAWNDNLKGGNKINPLVGSNKPFTTGNWLKAQCHMQSIKADFRLWEWTLSELYSSPNNMNKDA